MSRMMMFAISWSVSKRLLFNGNGNDNENVNVNDNWGDDLLKDVATIK